MPGQGASTPNMYPHNQGGGQNQMNEFMPTQYTTTSADMNGMGG